MRVRLPISLLCTLLSAVSLQAQATKPFRIEASSLADARPLILNEGWKFKAGDDVRWAGIPLNDSEWQEMNTHLDQVKASGWPEVAWFRLRVSLDPALLGKPLALNVSQTGTSRIYLDGELIAAFGESLYGHWAPNPELVDSPRSLVFERAEAVFAVRYTNPWHEEVPGWPGFELSISHLDPTITHGVRQVRNNSILEMVVVITPLVFALLHFLLFVFYPRARENLYYAIFTACIAGMEFMVHEKGFQFIDATPLALLYSLMSDQLSIPMLFAGMLFLYTLIAAHPPKHFYLFLGIGIVLGFALGLVKHDSIRLLFLLYAFLALLEMLRIIAVAIKQKKEGVWIVAAGFILFIVTGCGLILSATGLTKQSFFFTGFWTVGILGLLLSMSVYLSRGFARTHRRLEKQLVEVKELSAQMLEKEREARAREIEKERLRVENERKTRELEEARQLQLSMLPKQLPKLPNLDIAVYMKTATEVGGDYYDFDFTNETLTIAIGDATGHGMKAGTMVAATKSLFKALANERDIPTIFKQISTTLKSMNLGFMYMAMTVIKLTGNRVRISAAGMPPAFVYHAGTRRLEEVLLKAMPLGGFPNFPYQQYEFSIQPGDAIILMSDGFPEMFNKKGEILDYPVAREIASEVAGQPPQQIIDHLVDAGRRWSDGRAQDDDVTFVVLKLRE